MKNKKIKLILGRPSYGWLPTEFYSGDFSLNFVASDVPKSPTESLCEGLIKVLKGLQTEVYWFLEPDYYLFKITPEGKEYQLIIFENSNAQKEEKIHKISGNFEEIILPLYRGLKKFESSNFEPKDWEKTDRINELTELIKNRKITKQNYGKIRRLQPKT